MADFKINRIRFTWKSDWATATAYTKDDIVRYGGKSYVCLVGHTASANFNTDLNYINTATQPDQAEPKWTLWFDGYEWKNNWAVSTFYKIGDYVKYGSIIYICVTGHTSAASVALGLEANQSAWTRYAVTDEWKSIWAPSTRYKLNDFVRYGGTLYRCNLGHTSAITSVLGLEADLSKWDVITYAYDWQTDWKTSTRYKLGDVVRNNGIIYKCVTGHTSAAGTSIIISGSSGTTITASATLPAGVTIGTPITFSTSFGNIDTPGNGIVAGPVYYILTTTAGSGATFTVSSTPGGGTIQVGTSSLLAISAVVGTTAGITPDISKWTTVHNGIDYRFTWKINSRYELNDIVKYGADLYICTTAHTSSASSNEFNASNFAIWVPGLQYADVWDDTIYYVKGDIVTYGGYQYTSNTSLNVNNTPSTDLTNWTLLVKNYNIRNEWNILTEYKTGDLIRRNGYLYVATLDNISAEPTDSANTLSWKLVNPGIQWKGPWAKEREYTIGDVVTFYSTAYICKTQHTSLLTYSPLADIQTNEDNWIIYIRGEQYQTLQYQGDIQTYNNEQWASTPLGQDGNLLKVQLKQQLVGATFVDPRLPIPAWDNWGIVGKVYYVAPTGQDIGNGVLQGTYGTTISTPWKTIRYACQQIMISGGPATINIKTGSYGEILPISIPAGVALCGDELRGTVVFPAKTIDCIATASESVTDTITVNTTFGMSANDPVQFVAPVLITSCNQTTALNNTIYLAAVFGAYVNMPIVFNGATFGGLVNNQVYYIQTFDSATSTVRVSDTFGGDIITLTDGQGALTATAGGFAGLTIGQQYYVIGSSITATTLQISNQPGGTTPVSLSDSVNQYCHIYGGDAIKDMFYVRNACGIRNMTLKGLLGGLGSANQYGTQRPTSGAYTSLDPGTGPSDTNVWITSKSPYTQNVTLFGQGCTGLKIDGSLHNGGNRSIVANDYTTLISDGIGVWCTGSSALTELVSVFAYYSHCGYIAEAGGRIRATNGNTSYGTYGTVAEGFDITESPLIGTINNRNQHAQIEAAFIGEATNKILRLEYSNAGQNYSGATFAFGGAGQGAMAVADEFRDNGIFEFRITGTDFGAGGLGYLSAGNQAQAGDTQSITIASNDQNTFANYSGMRVVVTSGTGVGQYGQIGYFNVVSKLITIVNESIPSQTSTQTSSAGNVITVGSTAGFPPGTAIVIVPNKQTTTAFSSSRTIATMTQAYIVGNTLFVKQMGAGNIAVGMVLTGSTIIAGTYITANNSGTGTGSTWNISTIQTVGSFAVPVLLTGTNNLITLASTNGMVTGEQIVFTGTTFGGLVSGTKYYIVNILENRIAISETYGGSVKTISNGSGQMVAVAGGMLGGLIEGQTYYVIATGYTGTNFSVSLTLGGTVEPVQTQTFGSKMDVLTVGWENVIAGTPAAPILDSTSVYSIEPAIKVSAPDYSQTASSFPSNTTWVSAAFGNGIWIAIASSGSTAKSVDGTIWTSGLHLPAPDIVWRDITFGNGFFVAVATGSADAAYSTDGAAWSTGTTVSGAGGCQAVAYGNSRYIAIPTDSGSVASRSQFGDFWNSISLPGTAEWKDIAYSNIGTWVAIAGNGSNLVGYSLNDGDTWSSSTLPATANWISVTWGNSRFVAIATGGSAAAISFDGVTWIASTLPVSSAWTKIAYGQGVFLVVATSTSTAISSQDGVVWTTRTLPSNSSWNTPVFGNPINLATGLPTPTWIVVTGTATTAVLKLGAKAFARATVANQKISLVKILEPGSSYNATPVITVGDPNPTSVVQFVPRIATGVLGNPTFANRGTGYRTSTTVVTVATGTGFADIYQPNKFLTVSGLSSLPTPGAAITIASNATQYRIVLITDLGTGTAKFQISPPLTISSAPDHGQSISIRQRYSQCRITGHDFLLIGTGNFTVTNYPNTDITTATPYTQIAENNGGRVFQTSTDQDGNFKVGNLFAVQQASGIVTISADQLSLEGLQTLSLGGFSLGTNAVVVTQFSTDTYFTQNSDTIVPTQRAIKTYIGRNIAGGGSNAQAGAVVAGTFGVGGPNRIYSSTQTQLFVRNSMRLTKGINGTMLAKSFFAHGFAVGGSDAGK